MVNDNLFNFIMDHAKKLLYPEEWIKIDLQLSKSELFSMLIIDRHSEIIMSQIADYIQVPMSTATSIIDRLVKKGLVRRERSETDRRIVVIRLSDKGTEMIREMKQQILKYVNIVEEALTDEEKQFVLHLYSKVIKTLNKESEDNRNEETSKNKITRIDID